MNTAETAPANIRDQGASGIRCTLSKEHLAELEKSGITPEVAASAGLRSVTSREASRLLSWRSTTDDLGPCLFIPYFDLDGKATGYSQIKPTHPRHDKPEDGKPPKPIKYESPKGSTNRLYFPPAAREKLQDPKSSVLITEGAKKALLATIHGYAAVAVVGVWNWVKGGRQTDTAGKKVGRPELLDDFAMLQLGGRKVLLVFDADAASNETVIAAEKSLVHTLIKAGAFVVVIRLPAGSAGEKQGLDDFIVASGHETFAKWVEESEQRAANETASHAGIDREAGIPRITIYTTEFQTNDMARAALAADPELYQRGGSLVRVLNANANTPEDKSLRVAAGTPEIVPIKRALTRERLTKCAAWQKEKVRDGQVEFVAAHPPNWSIDAVHDAGEWPGMRTLDTLATYPMILPTGEVAAGGYYADDHLLVILPRDFRIEVPDRPTAGDVGDAVRLLLDVVCKFPFAGEPHRSAWLASLLTPLAWQMFSGPAPMFLFDKYVRGAGASLLSSLHDCLRARIRDRNLHERPG